MRPSILASTTRLLAGALLLTLPTGVAAQPTTTRVSVGLGGAQGNGFDPAISADGRWVVFTSFSSQLVVGDTNGTSDVFVHDQQTGTTTRVSVGPGGLEGNGYSSGRAISAEGRWVAFISDASNLVAGDANATRDVFVHDRQTATTTRVSLGPAGVQANAYSEHPLISADGRWVTFYSAASNLVADDANGAVDVFVHDRQTGTTTRASVGTGGLEGNGSSVNGTISDDGRWVAFESVASNFVGGDTNGDFDVFVHDRQSGTTTRVSVDSAGAGGNDGSRGTALSADGRWVAFCSYATNLVTGDSNGRQDAFVHDRQTAATTRVSVGPGGVQGNGDSCSSTISADGRWVAFSSVAANLVAGDTNGRYDAFVHDRHTGTTTRVSVGSTAGEGDNSSGSPAISGDGRWVAFDSYASNLVVGDTNSYLDVFVRDRIDPACSATLSPTAATASAAATTDVVQVTAPPGCAWTAVSNDPAWLTVAGGAGGTGTGTAGYSVAANAGGPRSGSLTIWDQRFTVHQVSATIPETPTGLVTASLAGNLVTLRWTIPPFGPPPTNFLLEGGVNPGQVLASIPTGSTAPTFTFAAPSGSFYVRVHAVSGAHRSAASNEVRIHVNASVAPSAPANLIGLVNGSTLTLAWTNTYAGGEPVRLWLGVGGAFYGGFYLNLADSFTFAGVPPGTYTLALWAQNAAGNSPMSNVVTLSFPGGCSGPPDTPTDVRSYRVGRTVFVAWAPGTAGAAPTSYVLNVTGSYVGGFATGGRALSGTVGPGSYTLSVIAVNPCGQSAPAAPQTVVVP